MKKIAVIILLLLSASLVLAQNYSEMEQRDEGNTAIVNQSGSNYSSIVQLPKDDSHYLTHNLADVTQTGSNNSYISQRASNAAAVVNQTGSANRSALNQNNYGAAYAAYINQTGLANEVQATFYNSSLTPSTTHIDQIGEYNSVSLVKNGSAAVNIGQSGNRNKLTASIGGDVQYGLSPGTVDILQTGNDNTADIRHGSFSPESELKLEQTGSGNYSNQEHYLGEVKMEVIQTGNNNYASQIVFSNYNAILRNEAYILQAQDNARAEQYQQGEGNYAEIKQWAYLDPKYGDDNIQKQWGNNNKAMAHTYGGENYGTQFQRGDGNWTYIKEGGSYNGFYVEQNGDGNAAFEETRSNNTSDHNALSIFQWEDDNRAEMGVEGKYNTAKIRQRGNGNAAFEELIEISDVSSNNLLSIVQTGDENQGSIFMRGSDNTAKINQEGNRNIAGTNASDPGIQLLSNSNYAEINQYGDDNRANMDIHAMRTTATIYQEGNGNMAETGILGYDNNVEVNQYGDNNVSHISLIGDSSHLVVNQSN